MSNEPTPFDTAAPMDEVDRLAADEMRRAYTRAMVECQQALSGTVHKGGKNTHQNYAFAGHEQVIKVCRGAMLANGLIVGAPERAEGPKETPKGWHWRFWIPVDHVDGHRQVAVVDATVQPNDKAAFVASTAADRTLRLRVCGLASSRDEDSTPQSEDPEHDSNEQPSENPAPHPKPAASSDLPPWKAMVRDYLTDPYASTLGVKMTPALANRLCKEHCDTTWKGLSEAGGAKLLKALAATMAKGGE